MRGSLALLVACALAAGPAWPAVAPDTPPSQAQRPKIGLVLSGGGARGGAHLGVLEVLEEMRVPVDFIVGTSAGSIIGAAYASGMPLAEIEAEIKGASTAVLVRDTDRSAVPLRVKRDDFNNYAGPEVGLGPGGLTLPRGVLAGVSIEAELRRLTRRQSSTNFDRLPVPFRAVATDLTTSEMVVINHGNLALAVRASMAVPAVVQPVEIDGRLLVDGGVVRNLPVDVVRQMGADIVIAVNIGTPLLKREQIDSVLAVSDQMLRILTASNVERSIKELGPQDLLITPELSEVASSDLNALPLARRQGAAAARALTPQLAKLALPESEFAALQQAREQRTKAGNVLIDEVRVVGTTHVNPQVIEAVMQTRAGTHFDPVRADADLKRIYARGDFESVNYAIDDESGTGKVLTVDVREKSWGPDYLRLGLGLSSDFEGNNNFRLLLLHRRTWLNALGAEWRNELQIGQTDRIASEWYQPLTPRQRVFVAPRLEASRDPLDVYPDDGGPRLARFRREYYGVGLDLGAPIGAFGEVRAGLTRGRVKLLTDTSFVAGSVVVPAADMGGLLAGLRLDTLDNARFPRSGLAGEFQVYRSQPGLGASDAYTKATLNMNSAIATGPHSLQLGVRGGGRLGSDPLPDYESYTLGGFLNLSGYKTGQFLGTDLRFARLIYNYRISAPGLLDGAYAGASAEVGRIGSSSGPLDTPLTTRQGYSLYVAYDTPLGPAFVAYGRSGNGQQAVYFFLGQP